jgi:hypothetical protein
VDGRRNGLTLIEGASDVNLTFGPLGRGVEALCHRLHIYGLIAGSNEPYEEGLCARRSVADRV